MPKNQFQWRQSQWGPRGPDPTKTSEADFKYFVPVLPFFLKLIIFGSYLEVVVIFVARVLNYS